MVFSVFFLATFASGFVIQDAKIDPSTLSGKPLVDYVNRAQSLFVAKHTEISDAEMRFKVMDAKYAEPSDIGDELVSVVESSSTNLPDHFDSRDNWPNCKSIKLIRNQATCGSCWAFGTAEVISDRICIQSNGTQQPIISPEDVLSCCGDECGNGCEGGYTIMSLTWWKSKGIVTGGDYNGAGCRPYSFAPCTKNPCEESTTPACVTSCQKGFSVGYSADKHYGKSAYKVSNTVSAIQTEIYKHGPVTASYIVYKDFYQYDSGIYIHTGGSKVGGHAVKIIGWGTENNVDYWLIANSWGNSFGESGFFRIRRGTNECGIESNIVAGIPKYGEFEDDDGSAGTCSFLVCILMAMTYYLI